MIKIRQQMMRFYVTNVTVGWGRLGAGQTWGGRGKALAGWRHAGGHTPPDDTHDHDPSQRCSSEALARVLKDPA